MQITREQLANNQDGFAAVVDTGAFQTLEAWFDEHSLEGNPAGATIQDLGEVYIRESGIKSVFRAFREFAQGADTTLSPDPFEEESLEDDTESMLD
jgi:hypothetical protein